MSEKNPLRMIDVSKKDIVHREAEAEGRIYLKMDTIKAIKEGRIKKGDPLAAAEISCILAVKKTPELIPLCHPIPLTSIDVNFDFEESSLRIWCQVTADYKTGVEMEALTGVTTGLLTLWDMVKYLEKDERGQYASTSISEVRVIEKRKE
jgi:cyclic pyranopterin phosphate synthase